MKFNHLSPLTLALITSCQTINNSSNSEVDTLTNNVEDKQCQLAEGYVWSNLKNACVRPFEQGISLDILNTSTSYQTRAYVLLDSIQKKAEIFVSNEDSSILLNQSNDTLFTNGKFNLAKINYCWTLSLNQIKLYQERK